MERPSIPAGMVVQVYMIPIRQAVGLASRSGLEWVFEGIWHSLGVYKDLIMKKDK
jgi:hypothetical protein